jgi:tryptophan synthase alpha subunit
MKSNDATQRNVENLDLDRMQKVNVTRIFNGFTISTRKLARRAYKYSDGTTMVTFEKKMETQRIA